MPASGSTKARKARATEKTRSKVMEDEDNMEVVEEGDINGEGSDEEFDLRKALEHYQRKKESKSSSRSVASTQERNRIAEQARLEANTFVQDGTELLQNMLATSKTIRSESIDYTELLAGLESASIAEEATLNVLSEWNHNLASLVQQRTESFEAASATLESHAEQRHTALRDIIRDAKACVREGEDMRRVASDASAYIRSFKAMFAK